jgi:hypothetical protein
MAPPAPVSSPLRFWKARIVAVSQRVTGRRVCVVVMAITFIWTGSGPVPGGPPPGSLGLTLIIPDHGDLHLCPG